MANKRISELVQITSAELTPSDLLLLADIAPNPESKKLQLSDLSTYLLSGGNLSGSFFGTASWANWAVNALNAPVQVSASYANTSSWSWNSITASRALSAVSSSYSLSGSYVISASYAMTSSVQLIYSSAFAEYARSASYLIYVPGLANGTASFALLASTSSYALSASNARTASFGLLAFTSSYARTASLSHVATIASQSLTASHTEFAAGSGVAGYATSAGTATTAYNGIQDRKFALAVVKQTGNSITEGTPDNIIDLVVTMSVTRNAPTYLVNMSVAVGGVTAIALWRSSSLDADIPLISTVGKTSSSLDSVDTIATSYLDTPTALAGETIYYIGRVHNAAGNYFVNRSFNGTNFGTSSLSVIEF